MYLLKKNKKIHTFESSLFIGQSYFHNDGAELYLTLPGLSGGEGGGGGAGGEAE